MISDKSVKLFEERFEMKAVGENTAYTVKRSRIQFEDRETDKEMCTQSQGILGFEMWCWRKLSMNEERHEIECMLRYWNTEHRWRGNPSTVNKTLWTPDACTTRSGGENLEGNLMDGRAEDEDGQMLAGRAGTGVAPSGGYWWMADHRGTLS